MKILYIGSGFVGACSAAVSASGGHETMVYDIDKNRIKLLGSGDQGTIESCLFEEGLGDLLVRNRERIVFTSDYKEVESFVESASAIFMCLPTPEIGETGECDLSFFWQAAKTLAESLKKRNNSKQSNHLVIVNKSTVPIGTATAAVKFFTDQGVTNFGVASNPEFLVEGKAVLGSLKPDRIVVGVAAGEDRTILRSLYQRFVDSPSTEYLEVSPPEAEASKLLANYYLFNRLTVCFDVIGRVTESFPDLKFENLRKILTTDARIGQWGFYNSLFAGGSCFIKDARSLAYQLEAVGEVASLVRETSAANDRQFTRFFKRAEGEAGVNWSGKTVAILGTAFKRDTNDTRNSPSIELTRLLLDSDVKSLNLYDPASIENFKTVAPSDHRIKYFSSVEEAIANAEVVIISTDWPQFRGLSDILLSTNYITRPLIMDGRRMLQHRYDDLRAAGFSIIAVGSPFIKAK